MRYWALAAALSLSAVFAQPEQERVLSPELLLLTRFQAEMERILREQPNYTCTLTVERSLRLSGNGRFRFLDALRMEVALVGGKEMFAWPGETQFRETDLSELVGTQGAIGTGSFALHARAVFLSRAASFQYAGEEELEGRRTARVDFRIPRLLSGYRLKVGKAEGVVGERGSFWFDPETLELLRLRVIPEEIPPHIPILEGQETLDYRKVLIHGSEFLLPKSSELLLTDLAGNVSRNWTTFSRCRQYAGESVIRFDEPAEGSGESRQSSDTLAEVALPAGMLLETELAAPLNLDNIAVGDPVQLTVRRRSARAAAVVPKGARLLGRVTRCQRREDLRSYIALGIQALSLEFDQSRSTPKLQLLRAGMYPVYGVEERFPQLPSLRPHWTRLARQDTPGEHEGVFYVYPQTNRLDRGLVLLWETRADDRRR